MEFYKVQVKEYKDKYCESYTFYAVDKDGKEIFGAKAEVRRTKDFDGDWNDWQVGYGTCGAMPYKQLRPYVACIKDAKAFARVGVIV